MANKEYKISDELLAAYLDGNTTKEEAEMILRAMKNDATLREVLQAAVDVDQEPAQDEAEVLPMLSMAAESEENLCGIIITCHHQIVMR